MVAILICHPPSYGNQVYFLMKGKVNVLSPSDDGGDERTIFSYLPGQYFGESTLTGLRRSATCVAATSCEMLTLSATSLEKVAHKQGLLGAGRWLERWGEGAGGFVRSARSEG